MEQHVGPSALHMHHRVVEPRNAEKPPNCETLFRDLRAGAHAAFWLDSATAGTAGPARGRFSVMGTDAGALSQIVNYSLDAPDQVIIQCHGRPEPGDHGAQGGEPESQKPSAESLNEDILSFLADELSVEPSGSVPAELPFAGGYVGFLGYEAKALTVGGVDRIGTAANAHRSKLPDAVWIRAQNTIVVDHQTNSVHLLVLGREGDDASAQKCLDRLERLVVSSTEPGNVSGSATSNGVGPDRSAPDCAAPEGTASGNPAFDDPTREDIRQMSTTEGPGVGTPIPGAWRLSRNDYEAAVRQAQGFLHAGDSYEVCLTDTFEGTVPAAHDGLDTYLTLRRMNPAPYAAYLRLTIGDETLEVLSASPEQFLKVTPDGTVTTKPIKGTAPRGTSRADDRRLAEELATDPKTRAENLIITDLLRNDLGRICVAGSVSVPQLMAVESYATVHQLVTTVQGRLRDDADLVDLLRATFPGGSMTGAPKRRTLEIIDALEPGPRGIYSGALGYLGYGRRAELSIVIRTIVRSGNQVSIGAGGAIVLDSDPAAEFDEKELKAAALFEALRLTCARDDDEGGTHGR